MTDPLVIERVQDDAGNNSIALITLNRPEIKNAISDADVIDAFDAMVDQLNADGSVKVAVFTGEGDIFSGGGNIKAMKNRTGMFAGDVEQLQKNYKQFIQRIPLAFARLQVPVIAAVNGPAVGAGNDMVCMCDIAIASNKATFSESFIKLGIIPGDGGAWLLPRRVGMQKAMEMALTGRAFSADEALAMGLVSRVVEHDQLVGNALGLARQMATNDARCLRETKRLFREAQSQTLEQALDSAATIQGILHHEPSFKL
ncbi:enoyl-CoA hydratase-related protein [Bacterioplanoides sp.]|uniref:enoyl-CoA hydratase-related protein n=1 Tax=Bacterioplanoides sp. TaxID=2066072 RepID=UPI003B5AAC48